MKQFSCVISMLACVFIASGTVHADNQGPPKKIAILIFDGVETIGYQPATWKLASTSGDRNHWITVLQMQPPLSSSELLNQMGSQYAQHGHWSSGSATRDPKVRHRKFSDSRGDAWTNTLRAASAGESSHDYVVTVEVSHVAKS